MYGLKCTVLKVIATHLEVGRPVQEDALIPGTGGKEGGVGGELAGPHHAGVTLQAGHLLAAAQAPHLP